ncbi:hypothetical protein ABK905_15305 [Acerihabitans sp. KWT182]|uniref:Uncharacterized protein n=1 Tax=Acerihabitans sp. KWT182 TaxID=3157919 RepID=A0AAU7Q5C1_9GAMM
MKVIEEIYPSYEDKEYGRRETLSNVEHFKVKANACLHRKLEKVYNCDKSFLQRYLSMPESLNASNLYDIAIPGSTERPLRRSQKMANIHCVCLKVKLAYECITDSRRLNAINYIYLGSIHGGPPLHQGITLDEQGNLLLIKGKSKDLFKALWSKYVRYAKFYVAKVNLGEENNIQFSRLIIDHEGRLIAWGKCDNVQYEINFTMENISKEIDLEMELDVASYIEVQIKKNFHTGP